MDSAVVLAEARAAGFAVHALSFRYGQRHAVELEAAARVARAGGALSHRVVDVDLRALGGSALTAAIEVPKDRAAAEIGRGVPATYVPARNTVFLALALAHAEVLGSTDLFVGVNAVDYSGYPDCRPEFLRAFAELANLATASGAERGGRFRIHAPLLELGKGQIVRRAAELGVDLALTHTCYDPQWGSGGPLACGRCDACLLRLQGFAAAGWPDPLPYATSPTAPHAAAQPRPFVELPASGDPRTDAVRRLVAIVERLRAPDGCPWDREQTLVSLAPLLLEEAHELVEALESADPAAALEEAGDVLLAVTLLCQVAEQEGHFDLGRAARAVGDKLLRRHPHVFGGGEQASGDAPLGERATTPLGAQETVQRWEEIKRAERAARRGGDRSVLAGVPQGLGAVQRAQRLGAKAMGTGFRWPDGRGALRKLREELAELEAALAAAGAGDAAAVPPPGAGRERVGQELGDVLLAVAQLANYLQFDAEAAGRAAARRFERRFRALEKEFGGDLAGRPLAELMAGWARAKRRTAAEAGGEGPAD